jgi:hypothetical protein
VQQSRVSVLILWIPSARRATGEGAPGAAMGHLEDDWFRRFWNSLRKQRWPLQCALLNRASARRRPAEVICRSHRFHELARLTKELMGG